MLFFKLQLKSGDSSTSLLRKRAADFEVTISPHDTGMSNGSLLPQEEP